MNYKKIGFVFNLMVLFCFASMAAGYAKSAPKAADKGNADYIEAVSYYEKGDYTKAFDAFTKSADKGDARADFQLGVMYFYGKGVAVDDEKAFAAFARSADKGNDGAIFLQGRMLIDGVGVKKNVGKAFELYEKVAKKGKKGNSFFQYLLGKYYVLPLFVKQDVKKAEEYLVKAAKNDYAHAALLLAEIYETDKYGMKNPEKSKKYYLQAARLGIPKAQIKTGAEADKTKLATDDGKQVWILRKAGEGDAKALYDLALVYDHIKQGKNFDWSRRQFEMLSGDRHFDYVKLLNDCLPTLIWLNILVILLFSCFNVFYIRNCNIKKIHKGKV